MVCALSDCSAAVGSAVQQQQQPAKRLAAASELHERSIWLPAAGGSLLLLMREHPLYSRIADTRQLLDTLGQLLQEVLWCRCLGLPRRLQMHMLFSHP